MCCVCICPRCEDDLTHKLVEIIRANVALRRMITNGSPQHILNEYVSLLQVSPGRWWLRTPALAVRLFVNWACSWGARSAVSLHTCSGCARPARPGVGCCMHTGARELQACAVALRISDPA